MPLKRMPHNLTDAAAKVGAEQMNIIRADLHVGYDGDAAYLRHIHINLAGLIELSIHLHVVEASLTAHQVKQPIQSDPLTLMKHDPVAFDLPYPAIPAGLALLYQVLTSEPRVPETDGTLRPGDVIPDQLAGELHPGLELDSLLIASPLAPVELQSIRDGDAVVDVEG